MTISSADRPSAAMATTVASGIRRPRMPGWPRIFPDSTVIRPMVTVLTVGAEVGR